MDAIAPGLLIAQGIGRWGNYWNQELFGQPSDLPWALEIDPSHRPAGTRLDSTFHPPSSTSSSGISWQRACLILIGWRFRIQPPGLFALYVMLYTGFRAYEESLRIDPAHQFLGQRLNFGSLVLFALATAFFIWWQFIRGPRGGTARPAHRAERTEDGHPRPPRPGPPLAARGASTAILRSLPR